MASCPLLALAAGLARAQTYEDNGAMLSFQVWNPVTSTWTSSVGVAPGVATTVEWRVVANYIGTRTDLFAMCEVLYQPTITGVDDLGANMDQLGAWRNGGVTGNNIPGSMLTEAEGDLVGFPQGYGRVRFGGTASQSNTSNIMTSFRHSNGTFLAPLGEYIRIAGSFVSQMAARAQPRAARGCHHR
jgi:hypothetical protein